VVLLRYLENAVVVDRRHQGLIQLGYRSMA
jgi:hypothetical protein